MAFRHSIGADSDVAGMWEIAGLIIRESTKGVLFNDGSKEAWLPRRFIKIRGPDRRGLAVIFMPDWLAKKEKFA